QRRRDRRVRHVVDPGNRYAGCRCIRVAKGIATKRSAEQAVEAESGVEGLGRVQKQVYVGFGIGLIRDGERTRVIRIGILNVAGGEIAVDVPVVVVLAATQRCGEPVGNLVRTARRSDDTVAYVVFRIVELQPVRVVVEVRVPVVEIPVRVILLRLQLVHVHLSAEPDELFQDAGVVALARPVVRLVLDVLHCPGRGELAAQPEVAGQRRGKSPERVVRNYTLNLAVPDRESPVRIVGSARYRERVRDVVPRLEEAVCIVRMGNEGRGLTDAVDDRAVELRNQLPVHAWSVALVVPVVHATALAVDVRELSGGALTVEVLPVHIGRRPVPRVRAGQRCPELAVAAGAVFGGDDDNAIRRTGAVQCGSVRPLQYRDRLDVFRIDVIDDTS